MANRKAAASKGMSGGEMALLALVVVGGGYLLLKPSTAAAANPTPSPPPPPPPGTTTKTCLDGSVVPVTATCMKVCPPSGVSVPETQACPPGAPPGGSGLVKPNVTVIASGPPLPTASISPIPGFPWFLGFPLFQPTVDPADPNPNKVTIDTGDVLVYLQGFSSNGTPVYPGTAYPTTVLKGTDGDFIRNIDASTQAAALAVLLDPAKNNIAPLYYVPGQIEALEAANSAVLVWATDAQGSPLAWWLMNWSKP